MIRSKIAFLADGITVDLHTRLLTAYNVRDLINAASFPLVIPTIVFAVILERDVAIDNDVVACSVRILLDDQSVMDAPLDVKFDGQPTVKIGATINGVFVGQPCHMVATLDSDGRELARYELDIRLSAVPQIVQTSGGPQ
jgi:hypothetical protein